MRSVFHFGDARVTRIDEFLSDQIDPRYLFPTLADELETYGAELPTEAYNLQTGQISLAVHSWLVQLPGRTILIDPGVGNDKDFPGTLFDRWSTPYLDRLAAAGVQPEQVDMVLMSHLHVDHVGWNTRLQGGKWVPTFPNARHVLSGVEQRYNAALEGGPQAADLPPRELGAPVTTPLLGNYGQNLKPILDAGLADLLEEIDGVEVAEGLTLISTSGHSVDHASIRLRSRGEEAIFMVDVMHNPLQVYAPRLRSVFCEFPDPALASRLKILDMAADSGATCFSTHFDGSSAGKITRQGNGFSWRYI